MNAVEIIKLSKRFKSLLVLDSISLEVKEGTCFALIGPNGAGKSTLIKIMTTLLKPTSGTALVMGHSLKEKKAIRNEIGLVSENTVFYDQLSPMENLVFFAGLYHIPTKIARRKAEELLRLVDMWKWRNTPIKKFSTGMRQRINIIRGLMHSPKLLFLDEPTLALDPQTSSIIRETIKHVKEKGVTIFFTTHLMKNVEELADKIAIINEGKIITSGTLKELKKRFEKGRKRIEIIFKDQVLAQKAYKILRSYDEEFNVDKQKKESISLLLKSIRSLENLLNILSKNRLPIEDIDTYSTSLEEMFIKITSQSKGQSAM